MIYNSQTEGFKQRLGLHGAAIRALLHWLISICVLLAIGAGFSLEFFDGSPVHKLLISVHRSAGLCVLVLIVGRFLAGCFSPAVRGHFRDWTGWGDWAAQGALVALYAELFILPILGWALVNARGRDVCLAGFRLPRLIQEASPDFAYTLQDFHSAAAWILLPLIALHILWAIWRHFALRDNILESIFSGRVRGPCRRAKPAGESRDSD